MKRETILHAQQIATEASHRANGGVVYDHLDPTRDYLSDGKTLSARGKKRVKLWWDTFFSIIPKSQYGSHQPG